jgi:hypothetical protein
LFVLLLLCIVLSVLLRFTVFDFIFRIICILSKNTNFFENFLCTTSLRYEYHIIYAWDVCCRKAKKMYLIKNDRGDEVELLVYHKENHSILHRYLMLVFFYHTCIWYSSFLY